MALHRPPARRRIDDADFAHRGASPDGLPGPAIDDRRSTWPAPWLVAVAIVALAVTAVVALEARRSMTGASDESVAPTPIGYQKYLVFMADGVLDSLANVFTDGVSFQRDVMKRSPEGVAARKAQAVAFLRQRFGLDFTKSDSIDGATLVPYATSDETNYRVYTISGEAVPSTGWRVHDGGWLALAKPGGMTLRGDWGGAAGKWVPEGTGVASGDYRIDPEAVDGTAKPPIILSYQTLTPSAPLAPGSMPMLNCELSSEQLGAGLALGVVDVRNQADGRVHWVVRNVLTFS